MTLDISHIDIIRALAQETLARYGKARVGGILRQFTPTNAANLSHVPISRYNDLESAFRKGLRAGDRLKEMQTEKSDLRKSYVAEKRREVAALRAKYPAEYPRLQQFVKFIRGMNLADGKTLVTMVREADWLMRGPEELRAFALQVISRALMRRREALGLTPFDDPLPKGMAAPGQPTQNAFGAIKQILRL